MAVVHTLLLGLAAGVMRLTLPQGEWHVSSMMVIAGFTVLSGLTYSGTGSRRVAVQGTPLGLMLAAVMLGPVPAAGLGAVTVCMVQLRLRSPAHYLRNNLVTFVWFPLVGGLVFHALITAFGAGRSDLAYYVIVVPAFLCAIAVNFLGVAGYQCWLERSSLLHATRDTLLPVLSAELLASLLTVGAVWISVRTGTLGIVLLGLIFLVFQRLVGELLKSNSRAVELRRMATTDSLTGLANRQAFTDHVAATIAASDAHTRFAVSLIDLDRFKDINDTLGHGYGDQLLQEIARRLETCVGSQGVVARLGGDEFVVLATDTADDPPASLAFAERILECVRVPVQVDEIVITVASSIGIARFPDDGRDMDELMRRADVAMYAAKDAQCGCNLYAASLDHHSVQRLSLLGEVARALVADELVVHYQPIISAEDFSIRGAEALIRWQHPELGLLPPGSFMDSVEQTPMIHPVTLVVLERAIEQCALWRRSGREVYAAVNLSVRNLHNPALPEDIASLLSRYDLKPSALKLEITESMIMADLDSVTATIAKLNALGIRLSVDDFGTGFSSLGYLKSLPIEELKIDQSFISAMRSHESDFIIVRSTINLGHDLGLNVVAEGVEDAGTLLALSELGCDLVQGFHVSRPLPAADFSAWLNREGGTSRIRSGRFGEPSPARQDHSQRLPDAAISETLDEVLSPPPPALAPSRD